MSYEAVGDYLSKTNRRAEVGGQKLETVEAVEDVEAVEAIGGTSFLLKQIAKGELEKRPEEISVERVEQIPKKLFGEEVNKEIDYVKDLLKMQVGSGAEAKDLDVTRKGRLHVSVPLNTLAIYGVS